MKLSEQGGHRTPSQWLTGWVMLGLLSAANGAWAAAAPADPAKQPTAEQFKAAKAAFDAEGWKCRFFDLHKLYEFLKPGATDADLAGIANLEFAFGLDLSETLVTDDGLAHLKKLKNLTTLNLSETSLSSAGLFHLKELKGLTSLNLWKTQVTNAGLAHLRGLKNLAVLILGGTKVTNAALAHLKDFKSLTVLDLSGSKVTSAGLVRYLGEWPKLARLDAPGVQLHTTTEHGQTQTRLRLAQATDQDLAHFKASSA